MELKKVKELIGSRKYETSEVFKSSGSERSVSPVAQIYLRKNGGGNIKEIS